MVLYYYLNVVNGIALIESFCQISSFDIAPYVFLHINFPSPYLGADSRSFFRRLRSAMVYHIRVCKSSRFCKIGGLF